MSQDNHETTGQTVHVALREGCDWRDVPWLVVCECENILGVLATCGVCGEALGFLSVTHKLEVSMESLPTGLGQGITGLGLPKTPPLSGGSLLGGLSEEEREKERRQAEWKNGLPVSTEAQKQRAHDEIRLLQAMDALVEGPSELSLLLATGFDRVGNCYKKRLGPWKEHSRFQQRLDDLKGLIDIQMQQIHLYREALKRPKTLPFPDLAREHLQSDQKRLLDIWDTYRKVEANGEEISTLPYYFDPDEADLGEGITVICPHCSRANLLRATMTEVVALVSPFMAEEA